MQIDQIVNRKVKLSRMMKDAHYKIVSNYAGHQGLHS